MKMTAVGVLGGLALCISANSAIAFERGQFRETKGMAQRLALSAERVNATAQRQASNFRGSERRMLTALQRFSDSANSFSDALETYFRDPREVRQTLALLNEDSAVVNQTIRRARPMNAVLNDWDECSRLLEGINARFSASAERHASFRGEQGDRSRDEDSSRYHYVDGTRYARNGDLYYRESRWVPITEVVPVQKPATVKNVLRSLLSDR